MENMNNLLEPLAAVNINDGDNEGDANSKAKPPEPVQTVEVTNQPDVPRFIDHNYIGNFKINFATDTYTCVNDPEPIYLHLPERMNDLNINLNVGFEESRLFDGYPGMADYEKHSKLQRDCFLRWIADRDYLNNNQDKSIKFVAYYDAFQSILLDPVERTKSHYNDKVFLATKYKGHIFLTKKYFKPEQLRKQDIFGYHGYKFEQLTTSDKKIDQQLMARRINDSVNIDERQFQIFEAKFGTHKLVSFSRLNAIDPATENRVEIHVCKHPSRLVDYAWLREGQYLQWWSKCSLCGISDLVYGFRFREPPRSGYLKEIISIKSESLEEECKPFWSAEECLRWLDKVLNFIAEHVVEDDPNTVHEISWLADKITSKDVTGQEPSFLSEYLIQKQA